MRKSVVDTNVGIVANNRDGTADPECVIACVDALQAIVSTGIVVLDRGQDILDEYRRYLSPRGQPGVGDYFMQTVCDNLGNASKVEWVSIARCDSPRLYVEIPDDRDLDRFDPADRKFVAVALTCTGNTEILNAVDSDWIEFGEALTRHGIEIRNLCLKFLSHRVRRK